MDFDDGRPRFTMSPDDGVSDPSSLWENNCGATKKTCSGGIEYYGGQGECG